MRVPHHSRRRWPRCVVVSDRVARRPRPPTIMSIDPTHTSIVFSVGHGGLSYTYGFFREAGGSYVLDKANPANCRFQLVIEADSIDTNNAKRDDHLRGPDFFNVQQFPHDQVRIDPLHLRTRPSAASNTRSPATSRCTASRGKSPCPLRMLGEGLGPYEDQRTGFLCQLELKRSDYDMTNLLENNLVGDAVSITISFEGTLPERRRTAPASADAVRHHVATEHTESMQKHAYQVEDKHRSIALARFLCSVRLGGDSFVRPGEPELASV